jgi:hypothetical protein
MDLSGQRPSRLGLGGEQLIHSGLQGLWRDVLGRRVGQRSALLEEGLARRRAPVPARANDGSIHPARDDRRSPWRAADGGSSAWDRKSGSSWPTTTA